MFMGRATLVVLWAAIVAILGIEVRREEAIATVCVMGEVFVMEWRDCC